MDALRADDCLSRQTRYIVKLRESTARLLMAKDGQADPACELDKASGITKPQITSSALTLGTGIRRSPEVVCQLLTGYSERFEQIRPGTGRTVE
jgi:hypothetical protein